MLKPVVQGCFDMDSPMPTDEGTYRQLLENDDFLMVAPQVYFLLKQNGRLKETAMFFQERLKAAFNDALVQNFFIKTQAERVLKQFEESGIDVISLKGVGFSEAFFGHLGARPTSDIDLLIKKDDLKKAIDCVKGCGFMMEEEPIPEHFHCSFSKDLPNSKYPLRVEIHWNIVREDTSAFGIYDFWNGAHPRSGYSHIWELSSYHTFYMIILHGWRHNLQSLKYYLDIIQMMNMMRDDIDFTRMLADAKKHKTARRIVRTLSIVYQDYPFLEEWISFPEKVEKRFWGKDANGRLRVYANYIDYQFFSFDTMGHSIKELLYWMKHEVIKRKKIGNM